MLVYRMGSLVCAPGAENSSEPCQGYPMTQFCSQHFQTYTGESHWVPRVVPGNLTHLVTHSTESTGNVDVFSSSDAPMTQALALDQCLTCLCRSVSPSSSRSPGSDDSLIHKFTEDTFKALCCE